MNLAVLKQATLSLTLTLVSTPAFASACKNTRPLWEASDGAMTWLGETFYILTGSGVIGLFILMVLAARFRNRWFTIIVAASAFLAAFLYFNAWSSADPTSTIVASIAEGCVGPPHGGISILILCALVLITWQFWSERRQGS